MYMKAHVILKLLCIFTMMTKVFSEENDRKSSECISNIITENFPTEDHLYFIYRDFGYDMIPVNAPNSKIIVNITETIQKSVDRVGNYIIFEQNYENLLHTLITLKRSALWYPNLSPKQKFLIVTTSGDIEEIFQALWSLFIIKVVILFTPRGYIFSSNPYHPKNKCGRQLNSFQVFPCTSKGKVSFKHDLDNFNMCQLFALNIPPIKHVNITLTHTEKRFNISVKNLTEADFNNGTDPLQGVTIEGTIGYDSRRDMNYERSYSLFMDNFVWYSPIRKTSITFFEGVFTKTVWIMVVISFLLPTLIWWFTVNENRRNWKFQNLCYVTTEILALTLCGCIKKLPLERSIKCLLLFYLIYVIVIQTAFKANLTRVLTVNDERVLSSVEEFLHSDFQICTDQNVVDLYFNLNYSSSSIYSNIKNKLKVINRSTMFQDADCIYLCLENDNMSNSFLSSEYKMVHSNLLTGKAESFFFAPHGHHIIEYLNKIILNLREAGIYEKLKNEVDRQTLHEYENLEVIRLKNLIGLFSFFIFGLILSTVVFFLEVAHKKFVSR